MLATSSVRARKLTDSIATVVLWVMASSIIVMLAAFIAYMGFLGGHAISWQFLAGVPKETTAGGGIGPEIYNSFYILLLTLVFTVPIATAAGVYLQEYAKPGAFRNIVQFSAESLATIPSIVMGLFGLLVFVYLFKWKFSAIGGALTLTLLNLPALMRVTQEALSSVPDSLREASMGLGGTKWQTITRVVLPSAIGRMTTGIVLVAGRIFGETAALIFTAGLSVPFNNPYDLNPFRPAETLAVHLWYTHSESIVPDVDRIGNGSALVLLIMVLLFNVAARLLGRQLTRRFTGRAS
ncbi:phosphate transport system permease protein PstA [Vulcanimicrobium alpinum]|uniref:Phosphate transport system permease protein PstA n=2 Tax=Vulcanimicrobium alpinum TaxID=3016050 RepID=A0AAN2CA54_UNVUL|nr:phosphate ABC transporter permease PstA [Vulcanimicrobium alpinum]BDE06989.1 phosphate transport system permease protein PstA [Vulcanimicrobium alpinum]